MPNKHQHDRERGIRMDRRGQVRKAVKMQGPDYVPIFFVNKDKEESDVIMIDVVRHFMCPNKDISEWGFKWERIDETMGQPKETLINTWDDFKHLIIPDAYNEQRFAEVGGIMKQYGNRYYIASLALSGFTLMSFLRGFENTLEDLYFNEENIKQVADVVFAFEENVIGQLADYGFDSVAFYDDWGTQNNLIISPVLWREFFKPRYKKQFDLAHKNGLDVYFHSCGYIYEIIPDLIETGVDLLNLGQPNLFDIEKMGRDFGGKVCFVCPVSYQTTSIHGTREDIYTEAKKLIDSLGRYNGGLIGYVEEYRSIGLSDENYHHCINAFRELGRYK